jgi:Ni,Fe-hydrogenase III large subunit/Ni,Fe-hydrogenase III component G
MIFTLSKNMAALLSEADIACKLLPGQPPTLYITIDQWPLMAKIAKEAKLRLAALWATQANDGYCVHAAFARRDQGYALVQASLGVNAVGFPSITSHYVAAGRMERIMHDMFGLVPTDNPDLRPWLKHEHWPSHIFALRKEFPATTELSRTEGHYPFIEAEGDGVCEIPVGPVHAGIIEPGHFRFLAVGEQILNLEERLGYVHKGIEKGMEGRDVFSAARLAARVSGDATVAHTWAFCLATEQAAGIEVPPRALAIRAVLCERERMANHIGDIGAICNDASWVFMHMQCQRLREELARMHRRIFGHRLLMDSVVPGGIKDDTNIDDVQLLRIQTRNIADEMLELYDTYENHTPIRERVIDSGNIRATDAVDLGLLGYAGRSAEFDTDARRDAAYAPYDQYPPQVQVCRGGDVAARLWVRFQEIQESAGLIDTILHNLPDGPILTPWKIPQQTSCGFAAIESWRGEIILWLQLSQDNLIDRCYIRDPSMINWLGLELAARKVPVPDFPLNNKSFNCSYSGHDL